MWLTDDGWGQFESYWVADPEFNQRCVRTAKYSVFSIYNPEDYKRCICAETPDRDLFCPQETSINCEWSDLERSTTAIKLPVLSDGLFSLDLYDALSGLIYSECLNNDFDITPFPFIPDPPFDERRRSLQTKSAQEDTFSTFELVKDNKGRKVTDPTFRDDFMNIDELLPRMYIASTMGQ